MATSSDSQYPINTNSNPAEIDFSIHTMRDDLLNLQTNTGLKTEAEPAQKISDVSIKPISSATPQQETRQAENTEIQTQKDFQKQETPLKQENPFNSNPVLTEIPVSNEIPADKNSPSLKFIFFIIVILIICVLGLGGYYFWMTRTPAQAPAVDAPQQITEPVEQPAVIVAPPTEKYSSEKPNYLTIDLATLSASDIKASIQKVADELKASSPQSLYEFVVVDNNNSPVSFPIFATAANLKLSPNILSSLDDNFSIFFYNDNSNMRLGIGTSLSDVAKPDAFSGELSKQEKTFVADSGFLFLEPLPKISDNVFKSGTYKNYSTRYLNIDIQRGLSIDYNLDKKQFTIGTSKETLRAMLDKLEEQKISTQSETSGTTNISETPNVPTSDDLAPISN